MTIALVLCLVALAGGLIWAANKGIIPDPYAKWVMLLGGGLVVAAIAVLKVAVTSPKSTDTPKPPTYVEVPAAPSAKAIEALNEDAKKTDAEIAEIRRQAGQAALEAVTMKDPNQKDTIDEAPAKIDDPVAPSVSDADLGDFVGERESELHDKPK